MWFRKEKFVECAGCGCLMRVARKEVRVVPYSEPRTRTELYCGRCAPPYDTKTLGAETKYYRQELSRNIEVTEKGKDIKAKSAPH